MRIESTRLGEIEVDDKDIITFASGLPGYEDEKSFVIIPVTDNSPFYYMQAVKNPDLCLVVCIPFVFFPDYEVELPDEVIVDLEASSGEELAVYAVVTIPENFKEATANLLAPVIVNARNRKGIQYVPVKSQYQLKHRIFPEGAVAK